VNPEVVVDRMRVRGEARDAAKLADLDAFTRALDVAEPAAPHVVVNAGGSTEDTVRDVIREVMVALSR
jgi:hypothetical protein